MKKKVLILANLPTKDHRSVGGATMLTKGIVEYLSRQKQIRSIWKSPWQIIDYIFWIFKAPFYILKFDVISIHSNSDFVFTTAPFVWLWAKILQKKIVVHFFGSQFVDEFFTKNRLHRKLIKKTILNSDTVFVETKKMIEVLKKIVEKRLVWLPNSRKRIAMKRERDFQKKFVFISKIIPQKGIEQIKELYLPDDYILDVYGPIDTKYYSVSELKKNINYKGVLTSQDDVINTLKKYDVLVLPTFYEGEGYPGIIIEAFSVAMPVITTLWRSIPEIVTNNKNGLLIPPKNSMALQTAIRSINKENYKMLSMNAYESFDNFDEEKVFNKILHSYLN